MDYPSFMRIAELIAPHRFRLGDGEIAPPAAGELQVRVDAVGICGSDLHSYSEGSVGDTPAVYPMVLGHEPAGTVVRVGAGALLGPSSFFVVSNYAVWVASGMYPHTSGGLLTCYAMGLPFYRNDVISTALVAGVAFGLPVLARRMNWTPVEAVAAAK